MRRSARRRISAGLVATLLGALVCIALPSWPRRAEGWVQGLLCMPLRAFTAPPAAPDDRRVVVPPRLLQRERQAALAGSERLAGLGLQPIVCTVVARDLPGAARLPASLVLDRSAAELAGCETLVTHGDSLLGFLELDDPVGDAGARVALLHARGEREVRRLPGQVALSSDETLRFLIEPASAIDALPLRCTFLEDPYLASRLRGSGLDVRVAAGDATAELAVGLRVGRLRVWGYRAGAATIPVGLFVEPELDPRAVSRVVVWRRERRPVAPTDDGAEARQEPVGLLRLPAPPPDRQRWFLRAAADVTLPTGAAVLSGGRLVGTVGRAGRGYGLATPFGEQAEVWALVLLPREPTAPVRYLAARCVRHQGGVVELQRVGSGPPLVAGLLFSGSNGPDCPPGLPIGPVRTVAGNPDGLLLALPEPESTAALSVVQGRAR